MILTAMVKKRFSCLRLSHQAAEDQHLASCLRIAFEQGFDDFLLRKQFSMESRGHGRVLLIIRLA